MIDYYANVKLFFSNCSSDKLYNIKNPFSVQFIASHISNAIDFTSRTQALELGCGDGAVSREIAQKYFYCTFTCTDASKSAILNANDNNSSLNIKYICINAFDAPSKLIKESYDLIFSFNLAQYIRHDEFIKLNINLIPLLKKNGYIVHFSIPDIRKKFATIFATNSLRYNFLWSLFRSLFAMTRKNHFCEYEADGYSLWHSPIKIIHDLKYNFFVSAITPSDLWYRFDLYLHPL